MDARAVEALPDYTVRDQQRMALAKNYFAWQARIVLPELGQRVVEVGCGIGNFTGMLLDRESVIAVDIEKPCVEHLRKRYPNRTNLTTLIGDWNAVAFRDLKKCRPDSCVCLNVLEHIEDDGLALETMASILPEGGKIVVLVPAFPSLRGPIDRNLGHFRRYRRAEMARLAKGAGLEVRKAHYVNALGFFGWWFNTHVLKLEAQSEAQIRFFDRWIVPWVSKVEEWVRPPFGQSLFVVMEK